MSVLADISVWVDHPRKGDSHLVQLLEQGRVLCRPFAIGVPACSNLKIRAEILNALKEPACAPIFEFDEYMQFIDQNRLHGIGIGFVDMHLAASVLFADTTLWAADKRLKEIPTDLAIAYAIAIPAR